jgi:hypothetical protein
VYVRLVPWGLMPAHAWLQAGVGGLVVMIGEAVAEQGEGLACRLDGTRIALAGCSAGDEAAAVVLGQGPADREDLACGQAGGAVSC